MRDKKILCILICSLLMLCSLGSFRNVTAESGDPEIIESFNPPYEDEQDDSGVTAWVHADKTTGSLEGFAMAQADTVQGILITAPL